jgi:hypothetical protein
MGVRLKTQNSENGSVTDGFKGTIKARFMNKQDAKPIYIA